VAAAALEAVEAWLQHLAAAAAAALAAAEASGAWCDVGCRPPPELLQPALANAAKRLFDPKEVDSSWLCVCAFGFLSLGR
jgi:hypothetical protein